MAPHDQRYVADAALLTMIWAPVRIGRQGTVVGDDDERVVGRGLKADHVAP